MKKVIVTGSEGFIGSRLCSYLESCGIDVIHIDRKLGLEVYDLGFMCLSDISCIYHLAAQPSVFNSDISRIKADNIEAFEYLCDLSKDSHIKLVYASSATAYDRNISSFYGESKRLNEEYARSNPYASGVRLHNVYSESPRPDTIMWKLLNSESIDLVYSGLVSRHFTWIDDIVSGIVYAESSNMPLMNVYNPQKTTLLELAQEVQKYKSLEINLLPDIEGRDTMEQYIDTILPSVPIDYLTIEEGIKKIYEIRTHILE